jgi:hypothetical protein
MATIASQTQQLIHWADEGHNIVFNASTENENGEFDYYPAMAALAGYLTANEYGMMAGHLQRGCCDLSTAVTQCRYEIILAAFEAGRAAQRAGLILTVEDAPKEPT